MCRAGEIASKGKSGLPSLLIISPELCKFGVYCTKRSERPYVPLYLCTEGGQTEYPGVETCYRMLGDELEIG